MLSKHASIIYQERTPNYNFKWLLTVGNAFAWKKCVWCVVWGFEKTNDWKISSVKSLRNGWFYVAMNVFRVHTDWGMQVCQSNQEIVIQGWDNLTIYPKNLFYLL